jgi:hypothetical protein
MQTSSKRPEGRELTVPELDLPVLPAFARRPPVLTMDQYFALNESEPLDSNPTPVIPADEKCPVPFVL